MGEREFLFFSTGGPEQGSLHVWFATIRPPDQVAIILSWGFRAGTRSQNLKLLVSRSGRPLLAGKDNCASPESYHRTGQDRIE